MRAALGTVIGAVHMAFIAWMAYAPFSGIDEFVVMHAVVVPFLFLHWWTNADGCALTVLEKYVRGLERDSESFVHRIVAPIYVIDDAALKRVVMWVTFALWMVSLGKLAAKFRRPTSRPDGFPR